jgi:hypothetical protein
MGTGAMNPPGNGLTWRVERLEEERPENERAVRLAEKHELELHGELGVYAALESMNKRLGWINSALWVLVAAVIAAAVTIALAVH